MGTWRHNYALLESYDLSISMRDALVDAHWFYFYSEAKLRVTCEHEDGLIRVHPLLF